MEAALTPLLCLCRVSQNANYDPSAIGDAQPEWICPPPFENLRIHPSRHIEMNIPCAHENIYCFIHDVANFDYQVHIKPSAL